MLKHFKGKNTHRVAFAIIAMQLCVYFLLPLSAIENVSITTAAKTINNCKPMSDRVAIALSRMLGTSELVVWGYVETVTDSSFIFRVSKRLSGKNKDATLEVLKIIPDRFASVQPPSYQKGQYFILFLTRPDSIKNNRIWKVMGFGGEGQMPVDKGYVYFQGNNISGLEFEDYLVHGAKQYVQRFEFLSFLDAVEEYSKCFKWSRIANSNLWKPKQICTDIQMADYSKKSFIHNYLSVQTKLIISEKIE